MGICFIDETAQWLMVFLMNLYNFVAEPRNGPCLIFIMGTYKTNAKSGNWSCNNSTRGPTIVIMYVIINRHFHRIAKPTVNTCMQTIGGKPKHFAWQFATKTGRNCPNRVFWNCQSDFHFEKKKANLNIVIKYLKRIPLS